MHDDGIQYMGCCLSGVDKAEKKVKSPKGAAMFEMQRAWVFFVEAMHSSAENRKRYEMKAWEDVNTSPCQVL